MEFQKPEARILNILIAVKLKKETQKEESALQCPILPFFIAEYVLKHGLFEERFLSLTETIAE